MTVMLRNRSGWGIVVGRNQSMTDRRAKRPLGEQSGCITKPNQIPRFLVFSIFFIVVLSSEYCNAAH